MAVLTFHRYTGYIFCNRQSSIEALHVLYKQRTLNLRLNFLNCEQSTNNLFRAMYINTAINAVITIAQNFKMSIFYFKNEND